MQHIANARIMIAQPENFVNRGKFFEAFGIFVFNSMRYTDKHSRRFIPASEILMFTIIITHFITLLLQD